MHLLAQERALVAHADAAVDDLEPRRVVGDAVAALGVVHLREGGKEVRACMTRGAAQPVSTLPRGFCRHGAGARCAKAWCGACGAGRVRGEGSVDVRCMRG